MKTIKGRAKEYIDRLRFNNIPSEILLKNGYVIGATEQRDIDIEIVRIALSKIFMSIENRAYIERNIIEELMNQ